MLLIDYIRLPGRIAGKFHAFVVGDGVCGNKLGPIGFPFT